jgi:hypothetical protein
VREAQLQRAEFIEYDVAVDSVVEFSHRRQCASGSGDDDYAPD